MAVLTEKEIKTKKEIKTEVVAETETSTKKDVVSELQEIQVAREKYKRDHSAKEFAKKSSEYDYIEEINSPKRELDEIIQVKKQSETEIEAYLEKKSNKNNKELKKSSRFKIAVTCCSIILALMISLVAYNAVQLTMINMQIENAQIQVENGEVNLESAIKNLKKLDNEDSLTNAASTLEMGEPGETINVEIGELRSIQNAPKQTNWFNKLCDFLSNLIK